MAYMICQGDFQYKLIQAKELSIYDKRNERH